MGETSEPRTTSDVVCLGCGCLCDDIEVVTRSGRLGEARQACMAGRAWFESVERLGDRPRPGAEVGGVEAVLGDALDRAAELLRGSRSALVWGLAQSTTETARAAVGLADRVKGRVVLDQSLADRARIGSLQNVGRVGATLGEVRQRADLLVFWGCDPVWTHPRHFERYSRDAPGRFVENGRTVVAVDSRRTATGEAADHFVNLPPGRDREMFDAMRLALRRDDVLSGPLGLLLGLMKGCRYGVLFYAGSASRRDWDGATTLVRALNGLTRFTLGTLGGAGNLAGAEAALTWQGGYPQGLDFGAGYPSPVDEPAELSDLLGNNEADLCLLVGVGKEHLPSHLPLIAVGPAATDWSPKPSVAINTAVTGLDVGGSVTRVDGLALPLRPWKTATRPTEADVLLALAQRVGDDL